MCARLAQPFYCLPQLQQVIGWSSLLLGWQLSPGVPSSVTEPVIQWREVFCRSYLKPCLLLPVVRMSNLSLLTSHFLAQEARGLVIWNSLLCIECSYIPLKSQNQVTFYCPTTQSLKWIFSLGHWMSPSQSLFTPCIPPFHQYQRWVNSGLWTYTHTDVSWYFVPSPVGSICIELTTGRRIWHIYGQFVPRGILEKLSDLSVYLTLNELLFGHSHSGIWKWMTHLMTNF